MYNKKTLSKATAELDKAKAPAKPTDIITDRMGQWKYPGLPTRIPNNGSNDLPITMDGVYRPLLAIASTGEKKVMHPKENHTFRGAKYVDEYPMKKGGTKKQKTKSISGTNKLLEVNELFKNYKNRQFDPSSKYFQKGGPNAENVVPGEKSTLSNENMHLDFQKGLSKIHHSNFEKYLENMSDEEKEEYAKEIKEEKLKRDLEFKEKALKTGLYSDISKKEFVNSDAIDPRGHFMDVYGKKKALNKPYNDLSLSKSVEEGEKIGDDSDNKLSIYTSLNSNLGHGLSLGLDGVLSNDRNKTFESTNQKLNFENNIGKTNLGLNANNKSQSKINPEISAYLKRKNIQFNAENDFQKKEDGTYNFEPKGSVTLGDPDSNYLKATGKFRKDENGKWVVNPSFTSGRSNGNFNSAVTYNLNRTGENQYDTDLEGDLNYDNGTFGAGANINYRRDFNGENMYGNFDKGTADLSGNINANLNLPLNRSKSLMLNAEGSNKFSKDSYWDPSGKVGISYANDKSPLKLSLNRSFEKGSRPNTNLSLSYTLPHKKQKGGFKTKLSKEEEKEFQKFYETLPENLQSDDPTYDIRGYWDGSGRPSEFDYSQPKEDDGYYHAFSINPNTGEYLKSPAHPTFMQAVEEDKKMGYRPSFNIRSGKWESEEVSPEYEDGGTTKNKKGTITNVKQNSDGSKTVQVKTKDGKYYEKIIPKQTTFAEDVKSKRINPIPEYQYKKEIEALPGHSMKAGSTSKQSIPGKIADVIFNPFTAAGYAVRGQEIPDFMSTKIKNKTLGYYDNAGRWQSGRNPFDIAADLGPIGWSHSASDIMGRVINKPEELTSEDNLWDVANILTAGLTRIKPRFKLAKNTYVPANQYKFNMGLSNPSTVNTQTVAKELLSNASGHGNFKNGGEFEQGGYIETELTKDEIDQYRKGGYIVEDISIPELNQAQKGGTKTHKSVDGTTTNTITKANGDVIIQVKTKDGKYTEKMIPAAQQKAWDELGKKLTIPNQKISESMGEAQQMMDSGELDYETWNERKAKNQREVEAHKQERLNALAKNEARYMDPRYSQLTGLPGESWRDKLANDVGATGAKFRLSQEDNFFDDYINPAVMIGSMAQSLGEAPKKAKESDSYMPYLTSIGSPLLAGALGGLGAKNNKQFINNVVNPLAGVGTKTIKKAGKIIKPIGEGAYHFSKNMAESFTPNIIKKYGAKIEKIKDITKNELLKKQYDLSNEINPLNNKIELLQYQLKNKVPANKKAFNATFLEQQKLFNELRKAEAAKKELLLENDMLIQDVKNSAYERLGTMKSTVQDDARKNIDYIYDFETGEKVPFNIKTPSVKSTVKLENGKPALSTEYSSDFEFGQDYAKTNTKNKEFVQKVLPGSKPFGSATFTDIGVAHASNDIDVAMIASDWEKVKDKVKLSNGKQAKYGPTINLGDEYGAQGNIDVNIIGENAKTKMAEGDFAKELYRQFFPDEFYRQQEELIQANLLNPKSLDKLPDVKINKTAKELIDAYDPKVKSILDAYETSPSVRGFGTSQTKVKQINRIDYILEQATDLKTVEKAQELFAKSIIGNKASVGYKFHPDQLSDVVENLQVLKKIGLTDNHNLIKIALDAKRMQLFLNDFYINKSIYNRELSLGEHIKNVDDVVNASKTWKGYGESAMGMGTNATQLGHPSHASKFNDVTSNIYYDLIKGKTYNSPTEYVDNIINQTSGSRKFNDAEIIKLNDIAKKHGLEFDENKKINSLGDLLDDYRFKDVNLYNEKELNSDMLRRYPKQFVKQIESFYKEIGKELGAKAIQRGQYGRDADYATLLNNFDEELDKITVGFNRDVPVLKSRSERMNNMNDAYQDSVKLNENEYYKLKYYLEGGVEELHNKRIALEKLEKSLQNRIEQTAKNNIRKNSKYDELKAEYDKLSEEIKINNKTVDELRRRQNKIEKIRPPMIAIGALAVGIPATIAGTKAYLKKDFENTRNEKQLEVDLLNQEEAKTGKLSEEKLKHRKNLKSWIQSFDQPVHRKIVHQARKVFKEGGVVTKLTPKEIQEYINQGYIVEEH